MARRPGALVPEDGPLPAARPTSLPLSRAARRLFVDRLSARAVTFGGIAIIASILAILVVILVEAYPLFRPPSASPVGVIPTGTTAMPLGVGVDEYRQIVYVVTPEGIEFVSIENGRRLRTSALRGLNGAKLVGTSPLGRDRFALGLSDGRVIPAEVQFTISYPQGRRRVDAALSAGAPIVVDPVRRHMTKVAYVTGEAGPIIAAVTGPRELAMVSVRETKPLVGPPTRETVRRTLSLQVEGEITDVVIDDRGDNLFVGTSSGHLAAVDLDAGGATPPMTSAAASDRPGAGISAMGFLLGDRTLVLGDTEGGVSSWRMFQDPGAEPRLQKIYDFARHDGPVVAFAQSRRDKSFLTADAGGTVQLHYGTTGRTLLTLRVEQEGLRALTYAPKVDGFLTVSAAGAVAHWAVSNPHPEVTLRSLFGKVWYEGYREPAYVWQSTGGTDDFEAKFSLTPLIYGTLKGAFYALLMAIPLALLGALYASQFMHPSLRAAIKPVVEIMAALPSVVLGFLAGLWLAPRLEKVVPGIFLLPLVIPSMILLVLLLWRLAPARLRGRIRPGVEIFLLVPVVLVGGWLALWLGGIIEATLLNGDYRGWLLSALGLTYDQRNSLVVGFAMGFAVIPIIFTIAEDSLSNVPPYLKAGSLALGATRWQTAVRVILPTASPGIFSAIMIGFGRAVGETMIVLMATGNTPVMNWSIFSGFRALSANVAVELPEAPQGGTLYRVLFVAAFLLFVMTFLLNTAAEIVRLRLRKRYQAL